MSRLTIGGYVRLYLKNQRKIKFMQEMVKAIYLWLYTII